MKIAVAGAGMAGSYMYRLLKREGLGTVDVYDAPKRTRCGGRPCAWGFAPSSEYDRLLSGFVEAKTFILQRSDRIAIDGVEMDADLLTVDKPALIKALLDGAEVRNGPVDTSSYDLVIDATGVERAYLGPSSGRELIAELTQRRVRTEEPLGLWIRTSSIGYEWCFPLGGGEYHIGFGNLASGTKQYVSHVEEEIKRATTLCQCPSRLRMSSPYYSQPFTLDGKVVGIGESIGAVAPLGGDGNLYAMQTAELLLEHWDDHDGYVREVLDRYDWMRKEREALDRLMHGSMPTMSDIRTFVQHARRSGFGMGPVNAIRYFRHALEG